MKKSFHYAFQMSKSIVFEVSFYRLGSNTHKYFSTSVALFNRPKTDYNQCGQAQDDSLKGHTKAMNFYKKWDVLHLKDLTESQHTEMLQDIEVLKNQYNFIERFTDTDIDFSDLRELSKMKVKKATVTHT